VTMATTTLSGCLILPLADIVRQGLDKVVPVEKTKDPAELRKGLASANYEIHSGLLLTPGAGITGLAIIHDRRGSPPARKFLVTLALRYSWKATVVIRHRHLHLHHRQ